MKILLAQPKRTPELDEIMAVINEDADVLFFPEGYVHGTKNLTNLREAAKENGKTIITSHLNEEGKNRASSIDSKGEMMFNRLKSPVEGPLTLPSKGDIGSYKMGYMLCREIFLESDDLEGCDIIFNPIGVGMFSEEQYMTWTSRAKVLSMKHRCYVVGVSHADGSYQDCGFAIPLSFVYRPDGSLLHSSKNDARTVIVDLETETIQTLEV